jgi:tRNA dimethylallyltransferase
MIERDGVYDKGKPLNHIYFVIDRDKQELEKRISMRVVSMIKGGLIEEVKNILDMGYTFDYRALNSIGYIECKEYLKGKIGMEELVELISKHTLQYAKRQRTWFKRNKSSIWCNKYIEVLNNTKTFLNRYSLH